MQSFPEGRDTTNPYLLQLVRGLRPHVHVTGLSWRRALTERVDVFHVHWPELLLRARTPGRRLLRRTLLRVLLLKWQLQHTAIVRTLHNTQSHEALPRADRRLLARLDRQTSLWIRLTPLTDAPPATAEHDNRPVRTIAHGHYRDWFPSTDQNAPVPGRLLTFGLIRPYKGIPQLIAAFSAWTAAVRQDGEQLTLHILGQPSTVALGEDLTRAATPNPRIRVTLGHASDQALAAEIGQAELVVLPYRDMHNSGAALLALSLDRPILVPSNEVTEALRLEVGPGWVVTYRGEMCAQVLGEALARSRHEQAADAPDLSGRSWDRIVREHLAAYQVAIVTAAGG